VEQLLEEGAALYAAQKYQAALDRFERAYREDPHCLIRYNLGLTRLRLDRAVEGVADLEALAQCPEADAARLDRARREIEQAPVGRIAFEAPDGTPIAVDDQPRGRSPVATLLAREGLHKVTFALPEGAIEAIVSVQRGRTSVAGAPAVGRIAFDAPEGVAVTIDGRAVGRTPRDPMLARVGLRKVTFFLPAGTVDVFVSVEPNRIATARAPEGPPPPAPFYCRPWPWVGLGVLAAGASIAGGWFATRDPRAEADYTRVLREDPQDPTFTQRWPFWIGLGTVAAAGVAGTGALVSSRGTCR
jgi:hypothetical protein